MNKLELEDEHHTLLRRKNGASGLQQIPFLSIESEPFDYQLYRHFNNNAHPRPSNLIFITFLWKIVYT
jgi:hypothetical protein